MKHLRIGSRKSALAQAQARWVMERLKSAFPSLTVELVFITTSGDKGKTSLEKGGLKGLFTKEIEEGLLAGTIDLAVHSLKDMAAELPKGLELAAIPLREDPRDVWISKKGISFKQLPQGSRVATSAIRRQAQLRHLRPGLKIVPLRGNVDTRLRKLQGPKIDGMVLALAGLRRLGREDVVTGIFSPREILPAIGQGALAIETRLNDKAVGSLVQVLNDEKSQQAVRAERAFLKGLGGNCQTPIAGYAEVRGSRLTLTGLVIGPSGDPYLRAVEEALVQEAEAAGKRLARALLARGAEKILKAVL